MEVRLNKYLADKGICSRREAEKLIFEGLVKVNGKLITEQGVKVNPEQDKVEVDNQALSKRQQKIRVYALNKPVGWVCSTHKTKIEKQIVTDLLQVPERVYPVGRLDKDSCGLLIMTNDGELAFALTHPSFEHRKKYLVESNKPLTKGMLDKLRQGMNILGSKTKAAEIEQIAAKQFTIVLREGKNRQIRRMVRKVGGQVVSLERIEIGNLRLADLNLKSAQYRELSAEEIQKLRK